MIRTALAALLAVFIAAPAQAEDATYGRIDLTGLARDNWHLNPPGQWSAMVCNVNGPDGYLSIRSGPGTRYEVKRRLKRLAIVEVDTRVRQGRWIKVVTANRTHSTNGQPQRLKSLHVAGWAHDGYLCDFIDY